MTAGGEKLQAPTSYGHLTRAENNGAGGEKA